MLSELPRIPYTRLALIGAGSMDVPSELIMPLIDRAEIVPQAVALAPALAAAAEEGTTNMTEAAVRPAAVSVVAAMIRGVAMAVAVVEDIVAVAGDMEDSKVAAMEVMGVIKAEAGTVNET